MNATTIRWVVYFVVKAVVVLPIRLLHSVINFLVISTFFIYFPLWILSGIVSIYALYEFLFKSGTDAEWAVWAFLLISVVYGFNRFALLLTDAIESSLNPSQRERPKARREIVKYCSRCNRIFPESDSRTECSCGQAITPKIFETFCSKCGRKYTGLDYGEKCRCGGLLTHHLGEDA